MKNLRFARIYLLIVVIIIFVGSSIPGKNIPGIFSLTPDKLIHCAEYAVLGFFLFRWLRLEFSSITLIKISLTTLIIGSLIGILDENYQRLTPGRTPNFWDWLLDTIGVILAIAVMNYLSSRKISKS